MSRYHYVARDRTGKKVSNYLFAADENDLSEKLSHLGFILISAEEEKLSAGRKGIRLKSSKILSFTINLSSLLKGGLRLLDALNTLSQDVKDDQLATLIIGLKDFVEAGGSFKDALRLYPASFSRLYISMVAAGEKTGKLDAALEDIANYLEWKADLRAKVIELATYPAIIFMVMLVVISILVGWVLPKFEPIFAEMGAELPLPTKIVLQVSHLFTKSWYLLFGFLVVSVVGLIFLFRSSKFRLFFDRIKLKFPIIGSLIHKITIARLCRSMGLGLSSGIGIIENLDLAKDIIGNSFISNSLLEIKKSVSTGGQLSVAFSLNTVFPPFLIRMIEVGERSGNLLEGFRRVSEYYDKEIPRLIKRIFTLLEPMLIVFMGVVVGGIALSVFLPLVRMTQSIGG